MRDREVFFIEIVGSSIVVEVVVFFILVVAVFFVLEFVLVEVYVVRMLVVVYAGVFSLFRQVREDILRV